MAQKVMKIHPICRMFSTEAPLASSEVDELREDIRQHGIKIPLLVNKKKDTLLDGRTRWMIATELGLPTSKIPMDVYTGKDEDIPKEILSRNVFRRHLTDDQRVAVVSKIRGPQLEKEAKERQKEGAKAATATAGSGAFKGKGKGKGKNGNGDTEGSVAAHIAKETGSTQYKAEQAEKARKAGLLDDVIAKKTTLRKAASKAGKKTRKPKPEVSFEDAVILRWVRWIKYWPVDKHKQVKSIVRDAIKDAPGAEK